MNSNPKEDQRFRAAGEEGLQQFKKRYKLRRLAPRGPLDQRLDAIAGQYDARRTGLYWYTELNAAKREASRRRCPILSLHLPGRLDRSEGPGQRIRQRYANPRVSKLMRRNFVLHWRSVKQSSVSQNCAHLLLDRHGRPIDALPGCLNEGSFIAQLRWARRVSGEVGSLTGRSFRVQLRVRHLMRLFELLEELLGMLPMLRPVGFERQAKAASRTLEEAKNAQPGAVLFLLRSAFEEALDGLPPLEDTLGNTFDLHRRVHERFVEDLPKDESTLISWIYATLFSR